MATNDKNKAIKVNIPEHLRVGQSANIIRVTTTNYGEVIVDFVFAHPNDVDENGAQIGNMVSRIVIPMNVAKDLHAILNNHLGKIKSE